MQALKLLGQQLAKIWSQLGINQKVVIVISGLAVLGALTALILWSSRPNYALLYARLDPAEAGNILETLDEMSIPYQVVGTSIRVPQDKVHTTRIQLMAKGMPKNSGVGFEIFDKPTFGMSDFQQQANYLRALQGELARTIAEFDGIDEAKVMIVKPENRLLIDPSKKTTASVFVKLSGMSHLEPSTVNSIRAFVANSVEGLRPNNVSVSDNLGNLLADNSEEGSLGALTSSQLAMRRNVENYLADKVKTMLEPVVGPGQVVVRVSAEINNETITEAEENFTNGAGGPVAKTRTFDTEVTKSETPLPGGVVGATVNANTGTNAPFATTSNASMRTNVQEEMALSSRRINRTILAGGISKVAASVFVNTNSNPVFTNSLADVSTTLANLQIAVQNALGLELGETGGPSPSVQLIGVSFNETKAREMDLEIQTQRKTEFVWRIGKSVLYALLGLAALFGFWKLVKSSSEELLPTGIPVGQLVGGQLVYEAPVGLPGMAMSSGAVQTIGGEQKIEDMGDADQDVEELQAAKSKLVMDFGLGQQAPERITIEVLKQLIRENPAKMSQAARIWMSRKGKEEELS